MERSSGVAGLATPSAGRPKLDNSYPRTTPLATGRRNPSNIRPMTSNSSLSMTPISANQFIALAREAMRNALEENQTKAAEARGVSNELKPGVTIDLSHKQIQRFPEEVVDIIKNELERLALSHNMISAFPSRFSECKSLRYLNVRNNNLREFPQSICDLASLEILDFSRNKLKILPLEIVKLTSLKVFSVQKNRVETLPLCIADMASLQVLKLDGNPIQFPPKEVLQPQIISPTNGYQENEPDEPMITLHIKRFLKQRQIADRSEMEFGTEDFGEGIEVQRPIKRAVSGRFPIKVNGTDIPDVRSPALTRPPPIPSRSHYRGLSQQNASQRRPGVMPLTIGSTNERFRRMGMGFVSRKSSGLDTVDEAKPNRYSHYRGLSHGSAIIGNLSSGLSTFKSPASPAELYIQRGTVVRRLTSLPECKRKSISPDPNVEAAKSILYALFQVHPLIQSLLGVSRDTNSKRSSLERVLYNATTHVEELDKTIQDFTTPMEGEEETCTRSSENVRHACVTCVNAYIHVLNLLQRNLDTLVEHGDPRYVRTLLLLLFGSTCEINAAHKSFLQVRQTSQNTGTITVSKQEEDSVRIHSRDGSTVPNRRGQGAGSRARSATMIQDSSNLQATPAQLPPFLNGGGRSATFSSSTPCSVDSFGSNSNVSNITRSGGFTEDDRVFEKIFLRLQQSSEMTIRAIPSVHNHFFAAMKTSCQQSNPEQPKQFWQILIQKCLIVAQAAEMLKSRLSLIKLKEPGIRTQGAFWELCYSFIQAQAKSMTTLLNNDVIALLRPLQKAIKDTSQLIQSSPWSFMASPAASGTNGLHSGLIQPISQTPLPMTPQSGIIMGPSSQGISASTLQGLPNSSVYNNYTKDRVSSQSIAYSAGPTSRTASFASPVMALGPGESTPMSASVSSPLRPFSTKNYGLNKMTFS
ncbi:cell morphogenesis protein Sog2/leucin rich repeat protein [Blumeria hordei DH14]|uniref:Cell morphogenesis protein Sog2/leucin rich repeat protein n=1 Tax=Blumeria graminis f. sp. hordei (strain DH14) TaxID=546991 RepID=N1JC95_BLUG1|nr:cell morphogenesis protein Sog2/leucin rich repeat protein [Blumeria hordei DH14]